jgi:hypothetical protein
MAIAYILEHRDEDEAFRVLMDRAHASPDAEFYPPPKSIDDLKNFLLVVGKKTPTTRRKFVGAELSSARASKSSQKRSHFIGHRTQIVTMFYLNPRPFLLY